MCHRKMTSILPQPQYVKAYITGTLAIIQLAQFQWSNVEKYMNPVTKLWPYHHCDIKCAKASQITGNCTVVQHFVQANTIGGFKAAHWQPFVKGTVTHCQSLVDSIYKWLVMQRVLQHHDVITNYLQNSNIRRTLVGNKIFDHSDVVGALPVGAAPTSSSYLILHIASMDWAKTTARRDKKHFIFGIWCDSY